MNPAELPLKDIHPPAGIGWWPPAPGWWLLLVLLTALILGGWRLYKRWRRKMAIKVALHLLRELQRDKQRNAHEQLCALSTLLRRVAISCHPRTQVAALTGQAWLEFLDQGMPDQPFSRGIGRILEDGPYRQAESVEVVEMAALLELCEHWLRQLKE